MVALQTLFIDALFDAAQIYDENESMPWTVFVSAVEREAKLSEFVQEFLQIVLLMRFKIKLTKADFAGDGGGVSVRAQPELAKRTSILSVNATNFKAIKNTL